MDNKEKAYTTDWKFFKNYIIYVNERNTKVEENKYEKKCYIGLLDQSQKRLDLLSNRIDKSVYTLYIHNSYLNVLDLDFVKRYEKSNKSILDYKNFTLHKTLEFKIEDKRISFLVYIMSSFFHINNLHSNLIATEDNLSFEKKKDYNIHQLYIDDLFLYILLKAIQLIRTPNILKHNFINKLIEEYNLALKYYCNRSEKLHLKTTSENFMNLLAHNSYLFSSIRNANKSIFTKNITLEYENSIDVKEYYSDFTDTDILYMLKIVVNIFKNDNQIDNYKSYTSGTSKQNFYYAHLKNKLDIKVGNIKNTIENIHSLLQKYTIEYNPEIDTTVILLNYLEIISYCIFLLKALRSELKQFIFLIESKDKDIIDNINSLLETIKHSISSLNTSSKILNVLLLTENPNSREKLITKLVSSIIEVSSHIDDLYVKTNLLSAEPKSIAEAIKIATKNNKEPMTTKNLSTLQDKLKNKLQQSQNKTTTLLTFIELFNLEQYSIFDSLVIINPEIETIYLELINDIDKKLIETHLGLFPFIKSIL